MNDKLVFYTIAIFFLCVTMLISHCTYSLNQCRTEAIKAGMNPDNIAKICHE